MKIMVPNSRLRFHGKLFVLYLIQKFQFRVTLRISVIRKYLFYHLTVIIFAVISGVQTLARHCPPGISSSSAGT